MEHYDVCIIGGAGHIGLPLSIALADKGKKTLVYDVNREALDVIRRGLMPFLERGAEEKLRRTIERTLFVTDSPEGITASDVVVVVIGTPVDEHLNPKFGLMKKLFEEILPYLRPHHTIILRSTVYPGTTEKIRAFLQERIPGIEVCFCPERIAEGRALEEFESLPQIVAGFSECATRKAQEVFGAISEEILNLRPLEAELAKLFTNSYRYIQFAISNQFYMMCADYAVDFDRVYHAMTHHYPRTASFPRPGFAAGPCLLKDTLQLSAFNNNRFFLGHSAMLVNEGLPTFVVDQLKRRMDISKATVAILGMAFKADIDDPRESLSYKLKKILEVEAKVVLCSDPFVQDARLAPLEDAIRRAEVVIIGVPHSAYRNLDLGGKEVVDIWGCTRVERQRNPEQSSTSKER